MKWLLLLESSIISRFTRVLVNERCRVELSYTSAVHCRMSSNPGNSANYYFTSQLFLIVRIKLRNERVVIIILVRKKPHGNRCSARTRLAPFTAMLHNDNYYCLYETNGEHLNKSSTETNHDFGVTARFIQLFRGIFLYFKSSPKHNLVVILCSR